MCGIVAAIASQNVGQILLNGLKKLEYRGYDSAGLVLLDSQNILQRKRTLGKVSELISAYETDPFTGHVGLAHTRWATHGKPSEINAHPHFSPNQELAVVHNGIIENYQLLKQSLINKGYEFHTETDTEAVVYRIHDYLQSGQNFLTAVQATIDELEGAFALGIIYAREPGRFIAARKGAPLVIGLSQDANYVASDPLALLHLTRKFIYLEEGDVADISRNGVTIYDAKQKSAKRNVHEIFVEQDAADKGAYRHFMLKEIIEQPRVVLETLRGRISQTRILTEAFGPLANELFPKVEHVQIVACGTSYHAGMVARYWLEEIAQIPCRIEIASEIRYRQAVVPANTLFVAISQSGETADTLAAFRQAKSQGYLSTLAICNVPTSALVREADLVLMTQAGIEIGVASTKAFTTQLTALLLLTLALRRSHHLSDASETEIVEHCHQLSPALEQVLGLDKSIQALAERFAQKHHALYLGRGAFYPIALEGALKLKEISYIHAEAYPGGELKHGPLALVDKSMPVVAIVPHDPLLEKMKSNLSAVSARGGELFVFADPVAGLTSAENMHVIEMPQIPRSIAPIIYTIPLQLLAYHVAVLKGTDVDQPRNLAKSVTVE